MPSPRESMEPATPVSVVSPTAMRMFPTLKRSRKPRTAVFQAPGKPAAGSSSAASSPVSVTTARSTACSFSERCSRRMLRRKPLRLALSVVRCAMISASVWVPSLFASTEATSGIAPRSDANWDRNVARTAAARAFVAASAPAANSASCAALSANAPGSSPFATSFATSRQDRA